MLKMPSTRNYLVQKPFRFGLKTHNVDSAKCTAIGLHLVSSTDSYPQTAHLKPAFPSTLILLSYKTPLPEPILKSMNLKASLPVFNLPPLLPVWPVRGGAAGRRPQKRPRGGCPGTALPVHHPPRLPAPLPFTRRKPQPLRDGQHRGETPPAPFPGGPGQVRAAAQPRSRLSRPGAAGVCERGARSLY